MKFMNDKVKAAVLIVSLFSCQQQQLFYENEENIPSNESVGKAVYFSGEVRSRMVNNQWEDGDKIGVYMFQSGEDSILNNSANRKYAYLSTSSVFAPYTSNDTIYFPQDKSVDFIAYYPYKSVKDYTVTLDVSNQSQPAAIDFVYSNDLTNVSKTNTNLTLHFVHKLSKLNFVITNGDGFSAKDLEGLKVSIDGLSSRASFDLFSSTLTVDNNTVRNISAKVNEKGTSAEAIVIPQSSKDKYVRVTMASLRSFTFKIATDSWNSANKYTYNITLNKDDFSVGGLTAIIDDWTANDPSDMVQEGGSSLDVTIWNGSTANIDWYDAESSTYRITTAEELAGLSELLAQGITFEGKTITLMANVNLDNHPWTPIGYTKGIGEFKGVFDGAQHTISGLSPQFMGEKMPIGLFGYNAGTVKNLIVDGNVSYTGAQTCYLGSMVGVNRGTITNCCNYASVSRSVEMATDSTEIYIGGLVGINQGGTISQCRNDGNVNAEEKEGSNKALLCIGGIAGASTSTIVDSENNQSVVGKAASVYAGGVVGRLNYLNTTTYGVVKNCANYGTVVATRATANSMAGGITGQINSQSSETACKVSGSYNYAEITAEIASNSAYAKVGGVSGDNTGGLIASSSNSGYIYAANSVSPTHVAAGGIVGANNSGSSIHSSTNTASALIECKGYVGGIAGYLSTSSSTAKIYGCCANEGTPAKWIGSVSGSSNKSGVTIESHTEPSL